jgi:hypothetical protein
VSEPVHSEEAVEPDDAAATLEPSEELDQDELGADPVERGVQPPADWAASDRYGVTASEQAEGEDIDDRLAEERPDFEEDDLPERPVADTPVEDLDESIDDEVVPGEPADGDNPLAGEDRPLPEELDRG